MEQIKQKRMLYSQIKALIEGIEKTFPFIFCYCGGKGEPVFTFTVEKKQEDHFVDKNGQKWIRATE